MSLPDEAMKLKDGKIIYDQVASMVAVQYSEAEANPAGSYVIYNGSVYLLPNGHTANTSWENTEKEGPTNIGEKLSSQLTEIANKQDAPETAGTSGQVLGLDANLKPEWKTVSGGGTVDSSLSENSTNPVQNKVLTKEIRKAELVKNDLSAWLYAENKYLNASYELTDLTGFNLYRIPCEHLDYVSLLWTGSTPFGTLGNQYRYTFEDNNGFRRDLTSYNIKFESGKVMFIAPSNAIAIYFCFKADTLANLSVIKNTPREYAPANDVAKSFIIPINNKTAVNAGFYLTNANSGIYTWDNASYPIWWIKVGKGDTIKFKDNVPGLSYNAVQMNTNDTIATISAKEYTFATDAVVCIFEQASNPNNCVIIPVGSKLQIDANNIYNSPFENTFNGVNGVAFGTSLTYRAQTTGGYLQYLPALSGITFDNQGVGSSVILGDGGNYDMLAKIKSYTGYSGKKVCILEGFVNDWYNYKTLGTWKDTAETSVCGCVRSALNYILSQNANITVFLVLDPYGRNYDNVDCSSTAVNDSSLTQYEYYSEIAKVAESLSIPVIKMFAESQISENTPQFMLDNIHPNALGAKQSAYFIWGKMKHYYANQVS